ncbi:MAG: response regulator transcription factor [Acidobacteria bacterium]|nr:response regulator transcription factor [Acidobacteriota bacterium]
MKVVIADDAEAMRNLLELMLTEVEGIDLIGMACNGVEAVHLVKELKPDVVVLDISMPDKSGIEVLKEIRIDDQSTVIIMYTVDPVLREACLRAGANFFISKTDLGELIEIFEQLKKS